eukprot:CAMPEP_0206240486 /NCGR_PEP_ID=MMETSP0047_2-20121206/15962_1 /ASSEMBLY_ACC=CAM_ASM_000192 /TAXON_ID=195065 /ORGANISM="Chroomonas mesostigmatica_cf, Strain CCMP1168" /LENGTH=318 /DNA_ID=CAMNT_0053665267 /DNA_START=9 /DNA_END=964 /DNA_ORIENTATION=-
MTKDSLSRACSCNAPHPCTGGLHLPLDALHACLGAKGKKSTKQTKRTLHSRPHPEDARRSGEEGEGLAWAVGPGRWEGVLVDRAALGVKGDGVRVAQSGGSTRQTDAGIVGAGLAAPQDPAAHAAEWESASVPDVWGGQEAPWAGNAPPPEFLHDGPEAIFSEDGSMDGSEGGGEDSLDLLSVCSEDSVEDSVEVGVGDLGLLRAILASSLAMTAAGGRNDGTFGAGDGLVLPNMMIEAVPALCGRRPVAAFARGSEIHSEPRRAVLRASFHFFPARLRARGLRGAWGLDHSGLYSLALHEAALPGEGGALIRLMLVQ